MVARVRMRLEAVDPQFQIHHLNSPTILILI